MGGLLPSLGICFTTQPRNMLMICLNFQESQSKYAYKLYAYKKEEGVCYYRLLLL